MGTKSLFFSLTVAAKAFNEKTPYNLQLETVLDDQYISINDLKLKLHELDQPHVFIGEDTVKLEYLGTKLWISVGWLIKFFMTDACGN
jgi:hypothetical protein